MARAELSPEPDFKTLFQCVPGSYLVLKPDFSILTASDAYFQATMTRREDVIGRNIFDVFPDNPDDPAATGVSTLRASLERVLQNKVPDAIALHKYDIRRPESEGGGFEERFWSALNSPVFGPDFVVISIIHRVEDVTEFVRLKQRGVQQHNLTQELQDRTERMEVEIFLRAQQVQETNRKLEAANHELAGLSEKGKELDRLKTQLLSQRSEEALRSEERYRQLFEANPHPMWVYDRDTLAFLAINEAAIENYGYSREEFRAMTLQDIQPVEERAGFSEDLAIVSHPFTPSVGRRHRKKDGTIIEVEVRTHELPFAGRAARLVAAVDVTEKNKIEAQLLRTQRMESIGTLAGGIAHDLNNVLAPILMAIQFLNERAADEPIRRVLETLEASAKRASNIVRQLLTFARGTEGERVAIQLRHLLGPMEKMIRGTFPKSIRIEIDVAKNLWLLTGDPTQLDQVLLNLCLNARDAMPWGGTLKLAAENSFLDEHYAQLNLEAKPGFYVVIEVADTGMGIRPEIIDKIFEPFYTTKEIGKGTGLGLSTVRAIVKSHGGFLNVYSEIGRGTRFKVYLPARVSADMSNAGLQQAAAPFGRGELILVVDDEAAVRDITKVTLESYNYRVITARDGAEALAFYARQSEEIQVVLLDMMMPIMDGPATIGALEALNPNVVVIAASGLIDIAKGPAISTSASGRVRAVLAKPYTAAKLITTLHEVIAAKLPS